MRSISRRNHRRDFSTEETVTGNAQLSYTDTYAGSCVNREGKRPMNANHLTEQIITGSSDGRVYYRMMVPVNWNIRVEKNMNTYNGHGFPFSVMVRFTSPDQSAGITFHSTLSFRDDYLMPFPEDSVDDFGVLHKTYQGAEQLIAQRGDMAFGSLEEVRLADTVSDPAYAMFRTKREAEIRQMFAADPLCVVEQVDFEHLRRDYVFLLDGYMYRGGYSAVNEAVRLVQWKVLPDSAAVGLSDPSLSEMIRSSYPNIRFDSGRNCYIYTARYGTDVHLYGQYAFYAPSGVYEAYYRTVFGPMCSSGVVLGEGLQSEWQITQDAIDRRNRAIREEKRKITQENLMSASEKAARGKQIRQELSETARSIRDSLENNYGWTPRQ